MGYYSVAVFDFRLKPECIKQVREALKKWKQELQSNSNNSFNFRDYFFTDLKIDNEGYFNYGDYYQKWYDSEDFALWLADKVERGRLTFDGESGEKWGYYFDGKGQVYEISWFESISEQPLKKI